MDNLAKEKRKLSVEIPIRLDKEMRDYVRTSDYANLSEFIRDSLRRRLEEVSATGG